MQASSGGSNPGTPVAVPAYSQCLDLENKMLDSPIAGSCMHTTVISGSSRSRQPVCAGPPPLIAPSISLPGTTSSSSTSGKRSRKNYVDPCVIAPLKKRRIQVGSTNVIMQPTHFMYTHQGMHYPFSMTNITNYGTSF